MLRLNIYVCEQTHEALYDFMRKRSVGFDVDKEFNSPGLFVGAAVTLEVSTLQSI